MGWKVTIVVLLVGLISYWVGTNLNKVPDSQKDASPNNVNRELKALEVTDAIPPPKTIFPMGSNCAPLFNRLQNFHLLGPGLKSEDFGNLLFNYLKDCHPNLNATNGIFGAGIKIELGTVRGGLLGSTDYSLNCIHVPDMEDKIFCQTRTNTRVWDENNNYGTLSCGADFEFCDFLPTDAIENNNWPEFGKAHRFISTFLDQKHGFDCVPENPKDKQNYNWDCKPF